MPTQVRAQKGSEETAPLIVFGKLSLSGRCLWEKRSLFLVNFQRKLFSSLTCSPTPVLLPGESQGRGSLVGCRLWGHTELDVAAAAADLFCPTICKVYLFTLSGATAAPTQTKAKCLSPSTLHHLAPENSLLP